MQYIFQEKINFSLLKSDEMLPYVPKSAQIQDIFIRKFTNFLVDCKKNIEKIYLACGFLSNLEKNIESANVM